MVQLNSPQINSATYVKNKLGSILNTVSQKKSTVIVEIRGEPKAAIISYTEYEDLTAIKARQKRKEAFARLELLRDSVRNKNKDIIDEKNAMILADEISRKAINNLIKKKKVRFK